VVCPPSDCLEFLNIAHILVSSSCSILIVLCAWPTFPIHLYLEAKSMFSLQFHECEVCTRVGTPKPISRRISSFIELTTAKSLPGCQHQYLKQVHRSGTISRYGKSYVRAGIIFPVQPCIVAVVLYSWYYRVQTVGVLRDNIRHILYKTPSVAQYSTVPGTGTD
jgi:hypothetical protein